MQRMRGKKKTKTNQIIIECVRLRAKTYPYSIDDGNEHEKTKGTKKCVLKRILKFNDYEDCILNNKIILKSQQRFESDHHNVYTEQINKIALSSNDDKRLQTFDKIITYPYRTNAFEVCKSEILSKYKWSILMIMQIKTKQNLN